MPTTPSQAIIRGLPDRPDITEINIRSGPGTGYALLFKAPVGLSAAILDALPDDAGNGFQGKVYQWLKLRLPDGNEGWARDDLLDLAPGDHTACGYPVLGVRTFAFSLVRDTSKRPAPPVEPAAPLWIPAQPAGSVAPAGPAKPVEPTTAPGEPPPTAEVPAGGCVGVVIGGRESINVRSGPSTRYGIVTTVPRGTRLEILDLRPDETGGPLRWVQVPLPERQGWVREDLLSFQGADCATAGLLPATDLYPAPLALPNYWWVRGYEGALPAHNGWDLGTQIGEPVLAGPHGGRVIIAFNASNATPEKPNVRDHGLKVGDPRVFSDPGWGFGYGHYTVVRYTHDLLPAHTRSALAAAGLPGAAIFVMYAHLRDRAVAQGAALSPGQIIGTCGNSGNSEAPHVHLEIRASTNVNETSWARLSRGLLDPGILFKR